MPRGNGYRLPGYVWHIAERCHRRQFLLEFASVEDVNGMSIQREPAATYGPHLGIEMERLSQIQALDSR